MQATYKDNRRIPIILSAVHRHNDVARSYQLQALWLVKFRRGNMQVSPITPKTFKTVPTERNTSRGHRQF
jgi:hypothetical protein